LLYARFFTKVINDMGLIDQLEPFTSLLPQGMVLKEGAKMSKSKGNVVDPQKILKEYGADVARLFILFAAPPEKDLEWSDQGVEGAQRFLNRVWRVVADHQQKLSERKIQNINSEELSDSEKEVYRKLHQTIKDVTEDIEEKLTFNTAISSIMELTNTVYQYLNDRQKHEINYNLLKIVIKNQLLLLAPFSPHMTEELWQELGYSKSIHRRNWPEYKESALKKEEITIVIQVNGKVRDKIQVAPDISEDKLKEKALNSPNIKKYTEEGEVVKIIVVPQKLLNIVVN